MPAGVQYEFTVEQALVSRILASRHFTKAPLLSAFLSYVCERAWHEGAVRIAEQDIGTTVFGREPGYDCREDNIVRNYARQLRRRLDDYYADEGRDEALRIQIPKGGYVPLFLTQAAAAAEPVEEEPGARVYDARPASQPVEDHLERLHTRVRWEWVTACLALLLAACMAALAWMWVRSPNSMMSGKRNHHELWEQLFTSNRDTLIVPSDTALVTVEDMNQREYSLTEYLSWSSVEHSGLGFDAGLRIRKYTDIESLEIVDQLVRLPEWRPDRAFVRTASNLHVEDLQDDNLILVGSVYCIPWEQLLDSELNFKLVYEPKFGRAHIENRHPLPGEAPVYANQWNGVNETAYAVLALVPNLNHTGRILLLEGLDGSGMFATKDLLFGDGELEQVLSKCRRPDGSLGGFEALIESRSVDSHSTSIRVISIHQVQTSN